MTEQITAFRGEYKFLSNFSHSPFYTAPYGVDIANADGVYTLRFSTVEHYFQASKATTFSNAKKISKAKTPRHAKQLGRLVDLRDDWDEVRLDVMLAGLRYKFCDPSLANKLLSTDKATLMEGNTWNDRYWGVVQLNGANGPVWVGENHLGKLLMQVRQELQEKHND